MADELQSSSNEEGDVSASQAQSSVRPLSYRSAIEADGPNVALGPLIIGLLLGLGILFVGSAVPYLMYLLDPNGMPILLRVVMLTVFTILAIGGTWGAVRYRRARPLNKPSSFMAGLLLGLALAALLEGICFGVSDWG